MTIPSGGTLSLRPADLASGTEALAARLVPVVCRTDFSQPGYALLDLGPVLDPPRFRAAVIALAAALGDAFRNRDGRALWLMWRNRFDQQVSTRPHRDGAPDESVLLLGYEPTEVVSRLTLYDFSRAA